MNPEAIEEALLSGKTLQPPSSPPEHSRSNRVGDVDDDGSDNSDDNSCSSSSSSTGSGARRRSRAAPISGPDPRAQPYANAQGRQTGVKGVLDDRRASSLYASRHAAEQRRETAAEQARRAIVGMTIHDEADARAKDEASKRQEQESREDGEARAKWRRARREELEREKERERAQDGMGRGGLKEIGKEGFLDAVERRGWVIVLIYEPDIPRCQTLLGSLLALNLTHPISASPPGIPISIFRARATSLRFSLLPPGSVLDSGAPSSGTTTLNGSPGLEDGADEIDGDSDDGAGEDEAEPRGRPDPDVLPALLAYKDGELERTWVRVDWEVGEEGIEGLLKREGILGTGRRSRQAAGEHDEEDDE